MDPNVCLRDARECIKLADRETNISLKARYKAMALDRYYDLDQWLSKGGFLPDDWSKK